MAEEAQRSGWQTLQSLLSYFQDRLDRWSHQQSLAWTGNTHEAESPSSSSLWKRLSSMLRVSQGLRFISERILSRYGPEIRFCIVYFLERKSLLSSSSATIAEALQGGKRVKLCRVTQRNADESNNDGVARQAKIIPMDKRDGIRLAILVALGRYLMERGDWLHQQVSGLSPLFQKVFRFVYPFLYTTAKGLNLLQKWRYLLGQSVFFDSYSRWLNLVVRRVVAEDSSSVPNKDLTTAGSISGEPNTSTIPDGGDPRALLQSLIGSAKAKQVVLGLLASAIGISWFARLQTTRQQLRRRRQLLDDPKGTPAPPKTLYSHKDFSSCPPTHCPICRSPRINPTASTSGYVFCLACLTTALRSSPVCPITGKDCPESRIVRLFEPHGV